MKKRSIKEFVPVIVLVIVFIVSFTVTCAVGRNFKNKDSDSALKTSASSISNNSDTKSNNISSIASVNNISSNSTVSDINVSSDRDNLSNTSSKTPSEELTLSTVMNGTGYKEEDIKGSQIVIVKTESVYTTVECWEKNDNNLWVKINEFNNAHIGKWGMSTEAQEGWPYTPPGVFNIGKAFGKSTINTGLDFQQITPDTYWVKDSNSKYYRTFVTGESQKDWESSENLYLDDLYDCGFVIEDNQYFDMFFLCCGSEPTSGNVALNKSDVAKILEWLKSDSNPQIVIY